MSVALLIETGRCLFGSRWQRELAAALGVNERTVRGWIAQPPRGEPSPGVYADLWRLCVAHVEELHTLIGKIDKHMGE